MLRTRRRVSSAGLPLLAGLILSCTTTDVDPGPPPPPPPPPAPPSLRIEAVGWGTAQDPDGFLVTAGSATSPIPWNGSAVFTDLPAAPVTVSLGGVAPHCHADTGPQSITLAAGKSDTLRFAVGCFGDFAFEEQQPDLDWRIRYLDPFGHLQSLTSDAPGRQFIYDWSPGGDRIVYTTNERGDRVIGNFSGWDVAAVALSGGTPVWLATSPLADFVPRWSPNGTEIVYARTYVNPSGFNDSSEVHLVKADGSGDRVIASPVRHNFDPAWLNGGAEIAFACWRLNPNSFDVCRAQRIAGTGPATDILQGFNQPGHIVASSQGDWFSFEAFTDQQSVWTTAVFGGTPVRIAAALATFDAKWSPDGARLAVLTLESSEPYVYGIRIVNRNGTGLSANLTAFAVNGGGVAWAPGGDWLLLSVLDASGQHMYVMRSDGLGVRQVTFGSKEHFAPHWRPGAHFTPPPAWVTFPPPAVPPVFGSPPAGQPRAAQSGCFGMVGTVMGATRCNRVPR